MKENRIVLKSNKLSDECIGTVRLTPAAELVVRRLKAKTGQPIRVIVSEIILQAEKLITIDTGEEEDDEWSIVPHVNAKLIKKRLILTRTRRK